MAPSSAKITDGGTAVTKKEVSLETFANRVHRRQQDEVGRVLREAGVLMYGLDVVRKSPSPHLTYAIVLDQIIAAVKLEAQA
jgi:hypothetical protein